MFIGSGTAFGVLPFVPFTFSLVIFQFGDAALVDEDAEFELGVAVDADRVCGMLQSGDANGGRVVLRADGRHADVATGGSFVAEVESFEGVDGIEKGDFLGIPQADFGSAFVFLVGLPFDLGREVILGVGSADRAEFLQDFGFLAGIEGLGLDVPVNLLRDLGCACEFVDVAEIGFSGAFEVARAGGSLDELFVIFDCEDKVVNFALDREWGECFCHNVLVY